MNLGNNFLALLDECEGIGGTLTPFYETPIVGYYDRRLAHQSCRARGTGLSKMAGDTGLNHVAALPRNR